MKGTDRGLPNEVSVWRGKIERVCKTEKMSTKDRIRESVNSLLHTYSADDLSVKMVCAEADISKQTLYNNYYGIYGVIEEIVLEMLEKAASEFPGTGNCRKQLRAQIDLLVSNKAFFTHIFCSKYQDELIAAIRKRVEPQVRACVLRYAEKNSVTLKERDLHTTTLFYTDVFISGLRRFADMRFEDDPDVAINLISNLLRGQMQTAVLRLGKKSA